jgi:hypothetical protein
MMHGFERLPQVPARLIAPFALLTMVAGICVTSSVYA